MNTISNPETTTLEDQITAAIKRVSATLPPGKGDTEWTHAVKRALIDLGKKHNWTVCASGFPGECDREWLYDMVWYRNEEPDHLREIGMVLECEWNKDRYEIRYDFEKLLIAKAPIKVMIFQDYKDNLEQLWAMLDKGIRTFKTEPANEKYILAAFQNNQYEFMAKTTTF